MRGFELTNLLHWIESAGIQVDTNPAHIRRNAAGRAAKHNFGPNVFRGRRNFGREKKVIDKDSDLHVYIIEA